MSAFREQDLRAMVAEPQVCCWCRWRLLLVPLALRDNNRTVTTALIWLGNRFRFSGCDSLIESDRFRSTWENREIGATFIPIPSSLKFDLLAWRVGAERSILVGVGM